MEYLSGRECHVNKDPEAGQGLCGPGVVWRLWFGALAMRELAKTRPEWVAGLDHKNVR